MVEDISKKAVLILALLAVVVSVLSTTLMLNAINSNPSLGADARLQSQGTSSPGAVVSLYVPQGPQGGQVNLEVVNLNP
jgi:hypothetical protein